MSVYIIDAGSRYIVREEKLGRAYAWLMDRREEAHARPVADGFAEIFSADGEGFFCGSTCYGFQEEVIEFVSEFCEPWSYASFRDDDDFEFGIVWKDGDGEVNEEWETICNPFNERMEEMDFWSKALVEKEESC